jgi:hypothetical protein
VLPEMFAPPPGFVAAGREHHPTAAAPYHTCAMSEPASSRRPVSQQRYAVRRFGVVVVLGLIVFGAVKGVGALTDEPEAASEEPAESTTTVAAAPANAGAATAAATTVATTPATPPPTEPEETGPPSEDNPAEVLIVGDSDAGTFAPYLELLLDETGLVDVELDYVVSSGLARPDFHDWPAHLRDTMAASDADIVIVTFGGNDAQGLSEPCPNGAGTCELSVVVGQASESNAADWTAEYSERVRDVMDILTEDSDRRVIWVGIPNAADPEFTARLEIQDQAVRRALEDYPDAVLVDTWEIFDGRNGGIAELVVDPRDGKAKPVRQGDGFHLNTDGAEILAIDIATHVEAILEDLGADV